MKKIVALLFASVIMVQSFAAVNVELPARKAADVMIPIGKTGKTVSLLDLATMSPKDYQALTGQHLKIRGAHCIQIDAERIENDHQHRWNGECKKDGSLS